MNLASAPEPSTPPQESESLIPTSFVKRHFLVLAVLCILFIGGLGAAGWSWAATQGDRIVPGVVVFGTPIGGLTRPAAEATLHNALEARWKKGVRVRFENQVFEIGKAEAVLQYDVTNTVQAAYKLGREGSLATRLATPLLARFTPYAFETSVVVDRVALEENVRNALRNVLAEGRDARLRVEATETTTDIQIEAEQAGVLADMERLAKALDVAAKQKEDEPLPLVTQTIHPRITKTDLEPLVPTVSAWLSRAPFTLAAEDRRYVISKAEFAPWITVTTSTEPIGITLDPQATGERLRVRAKELLKPAQDGNIELDEEGKAKAFVAPEEGVDVDVERTIEHILTGWETSSTTLELALTRVTPRILGEGERLGIQEIVGVGRSDFSGSPTNRRRNIALGAKKVGMTLVPPGEEFSMLQVLGVIDGEHGWLPELVIKGNKTIPEFGGGLCQVGTTMFRAALASGLPITERRNHSYRVRYYEPAGTDATIYDPAPDFRFKNDLAGWILVTTRIQGDSLVFTVWGKKDGRLVEQTKPKVFNIVAPPPKKIIETLELKPGEVKCTETEHAGADAQFDYTVTYSDGRVEKKTFFSRYRPWQAVCLKGVESLSTPLETSPSEPLIEQPLTPDIPLP